MRPDFAIIDYSSNHQPSIRKILTKIGWAEQYVASAEQNMHNLSQDKGSTAKLTLGSICR